jgi:hypothetical protein
MTQNQKIIASIGAFIVLAVLAIAVIWQWTGSPSLGAVDPIQIKHAVLAYLRDVASERKNPPPSIKLEELVKKGYLKDEFVKGFEGMDVTIYLQNSEQPTNAFMTVRLPSGGSMSLLNDGSVKTDP